MNTEDLRLLDGGRDREKEVAAHPESPTWIVNQAWEKLEQVAYNALDAYMHYCKQNNFPHSYLLGLDILITGVATEDGKGIKDIRPTLLEGPCCNSYPACPNIDSYRLYRRTSQLGLEPDQVTYPVHPTQIRDRIIDAFKAAWVSRGNTSDPVIGIFTRPYAESEEETAHNLILEGCLKAGLKAFRITPEECPEVKNGKLWVKGQAIDVCYRRIERIHVPLFYGEELAQKIINDATDTIFINPWKVDDLRSKTREEQCFRDWEKQGGAAVSRPKTLMGKEITRESVASLLREGGFAMKKWNSTGGKGVFLHLYMPRLKGIADKLYLSYDGRHMIHVDKNNEEEILKAFDEFKEDAAIQQLRIIDARNLKEKINLVYDTRINVLYNAMKKKWEIISGISRCVPCGPEVKNGNSLLTNVSSGAEISTLIIGKTYKITNAMVFGPLLQALLNEKKEIEIL